MSEIKAKDCPIRLHLASEYQSQKTSSWLEYTAERRSITWREALFNTNGQQTSRDLRQNQKKAREHACADRDDDDTFARPHEPGTASEQQISDDKRILWLHIAHQAVLQTASSAVRDLASQNGRTCFRTAVGQVLLFGAFQWWEAILVVHSEFLVK